MKVQDSFFKCWLQNCESLSVEKLPYFYFVFYDTIKYHFMLLLSSADNYCQLILNRTNIICMFKNVFLRDRSTLSDEGYTPSRIRKSIIEFFLHRICWHCVLRIINSNSYFNFKQLTLKNNKNIFPSSLATGLRSIND